MPKNSIEKAHFYPEIIKMMEYAQKSVKFYSVSCCFGFYSVGLKNFEVMINKLKMVLSDRIGGRYLDVQVLVKRDRENPIDTYAAERLAYLEKQFADRSNDDNRRIVFKEFEIDNNETDAVQFLIIDDKKLLISKSQRETFSVELDLVLNKSESGEQFTLEEYRDDFNAIVNLFDKKWEKSTALNIDVNNISKRRMKYLLENFHPFGNEASEKEIQIALAHYLKGSNLKSPINLETAVGNLRIDISVGTGSMHERHGIEIKFSPDDNAVKEIIGQMDIYKKQFYNLYLLIHKPQYSLERKAHLKQYLLDHNIVLIETQIEK